MKVLFVGNSHTFFNDMPQIFKNICVKMATICTALQLSTVWKMAKSHSEKNNIRLS